jgi:phage gp45-like
MKIAEITNTIKPLSPEKARVKSLKQGVARQKVQLAAEKERQHDAKHAQKMRVLQAKAAGT